MKRRLPLLLVIAALAVTGCGAANRGQDGPGSPGAPASAGSAAPPGSASPAPGTPGTGVGGDGGTAVKAGSSGPGFRGSIVGGRGPVRDRVRYSWRRGCPVGPVELRLLRFDYWGFDGRVHRGGELIVHRDQARRILRVMERLFAIRYPIQRLRVVDAYRADDDRSMAANNTSAFNCRRVSGTSRWSEHAFGRAIDLNPLRNPYVTRGGRVSPPQRQPAAAKARTMRSPPWTIPAARSDRAFAAAGWRWGGDWSGSRDYQHFSGTGR